jgi:hypothetical protein
LTIADVRAFYAADLERCALEAAALAARDMRDAGEIVH